MCTGYASIDIRSRDPKTTFQPLTHVIPWFENSGGSFHAVLKTMLSHCRYCHDEGHVLDSYSKKQRKTVTPEEGCSSVPGSSPEKHSERQTVTITEECDFSFNKPPPEKHSERKKAPRVTLTLNNKGTKKKTSTKTREKIFECDVKEVNHFTPAKRSRTIPAKGTYQTNHNQQMSSKPTLLNTSSLNCNSLVKTNNSKKQKQFIRYLRSLNFDIMSFQESHVNENVSNLINMQFQSKAFIWTHHCGIVSLSSSLTLSFNLISDNDRVILIKVTHCQQPLNPFYILNIYTPATNGSAQKSFFNSVLTSIYDLPTSVDLARTIIMGDFNYSYLRPRLYSQWLSFLEEHFFNALSISDIHNIPTFNRTSTTPSTIDYIFVSKDMNNIVNKADLQDKLTLDRSLSPFNSTERWLVVQCSRSMAFQP
ncbi:Endonuclease/exonuclease/phosphatase [Pilobolus umbonatus]|nr:Endonuclease/exonuclease/phosphatase [Pilobolus umbonatus]